MKLFVILLVLLPFAFGEERVKEVCYPNIGCFNYGYPFLDPPSRPLSWAPQPPIIVSTRFMLHTRHNPQKADAQALDMDDPNTITSSHFDPTKETKFICHGFVESGLIEWDYWMIDMVKEFLNYDDYNVIRITWGIGSLFPYTQAIANTRTVGAVTSRFMDILRGHYNISASSFHFIGHSLGAHVGGYVGERQPGLARITGLDPAGPGFENTQPEVHLDPTDAVFVDTIHTDAHHPLTFGFGIIEPVGHMDFYPNGGKNQPGCDQSIFEDFLDEGLVGGAVQFVACNHIRSHQYFSDSINKCPIYSFRCPNDYDTYDTFLKGECFNTGDAAVMGFHSIDNKPPSGVQHQKYYTVTTGSSPYCLDNPFQLTIHFNDPWFSETFKGWAFVTLIGGRGQTKRTPLNKNSVDFKPGTDMSFIITTDMDPGDLSELHFYWKFDFELLDPLDWPIWDDNEVFIAKIDVKGLVWQKSYTMCNKKPKVGIDSKRVAYFVSSTC